MTETSRFDLLGQLSVRLGRATLRPDSGPPGGRAAPLQSPANQQPGRLIAKSTLSLGSLLYLAVIGLVASATIGVFFGAGLSLPMHPGASTVAGGWRGSTSDGKSLVYGLVPPADSSYPPGTRKLGPIGVKTAERGSVEFVAPSAVPLTSKPGASPAATFEPPIAARDITPRSEAQAGRSAPSALAAPSLSVPSPGPSAAEISDLLGQGDALLRTGDLSSARLFYERATAAGDGRAALRPGATFDPAFLGRAGLRNVAGDATAARMWYGRALDLGAAEAKRQLSSLQTRQGR